MFRVTTEAGTELVTHDETLALTSAVQWVSRGSETATVEAYGLADVADGMTFWEIERDTKVDDADRYYPVIVHRRR